MILAIDIGNSSLKCAVVDRNGVLGRESLPLKRCHDTTALSDVIQRVSSSVLSVERAMVSSVVPPLDGLVVGTVRRLLDQVPRVIDHTVRFPFELDVPVPTQVGTDRLCAAAGAVGFNRKNAVVIDAGSAITVDMVRDGGFRGGVIAAGPSIALRALNRYASKLPAIAYSNLGIPFPKTFDTTEPSMTLGASLGAVGAIRESVRFLAASTGVTPPKYLTGGFGSILRGHLPGSWVFDPDLTLKGIYVIAQMNPPAGAE
jgi:type III pantothenate kinase